MATILLVDDNPLRGSLRQSMFERAIPQVVRVSDAAEALCLVESLEFANSLRLIVTGHITTGIPGPDFVAELRSRLPEVPVLVLISTPEEGEAYAHIDGVVQSYASAPDDLRRAVTHVLGSISERQTA